MVADVVVKKDSHEIIATGVSFEEYMEKYAGDFCELVGDKVIKMSPATSDHVLLSGYLFGVFGAYFELNSIGLVMTAPFVMKTSAEARRREPDLQIMLKTNPGMLNPTYMDGSADICIEIISPGTEDTDRGEKFVEYEKGGVAEYWIFDPLRKETLFYRLNTEGVCEPQYADENGNYRTPALPGFILRVPTLWARPLPGPAAIVKAVEAMLK
jgi:Uma2 family endonuclease